MLLDAEFLKNDWKEAMELSEYFSLDKNTPDGKRDNWSRLAENYDLALGSDIKRAKDTIEILKQKGAINSETIAMDIGCGTGTFVIELSKICKHVYALDYSYGMLEKLQKKITDQNITNITIINEDWATFDHTTLNHEITLSLSCLNTGMRDYDSLVKINEVTKGWCCYITSSGVTKHARRNELQEIVFGRTLKSAGGGDIIYPFNIIYALGYRPELSNINFNWKREKDPKTALAAMVRDFNRYVDIDAELEKKLDKYIRSKLNTDGLYEESMNAVMGVLTWKTL